MWGMGYQPTLKALGADVTYMEIKTPGQFVGLGAYAQRPGHSVIVDIDIVGGGGHATRLLKYQPRGQPRPSGVDPTVDSPNPGNAILADPGPGVAKEVQAVDLFQQATAGWMIRWH
jgi:hypothetical protein